MGECGSRGISAHRNSNCSQAGLGWHTSLRTPVRQPVCLLSSPLLVVHLTPNLTPKRHTISNLTVFIKEEYQRKLRQMIVARHNQLVGCLRVRRQRQARARQKKNHRRVVQGTEDNLVTGRCESVTKILWLIGGERDTGVTDWKARPGQ